MRLHAFHGVMEQERVVGNDYAVSVKVGYPLEKACGSDNVDDTVSYAIIADVVRSEMAQPSALVEHVAMRIARSLIENFPLIFDVTVRISKIAPPMKCDCKSAGVEIFVENLKISK